MAARWLGVGEEEEKEKLGICFVFCHWNKACAEVIYACMGSEESLLTAVICKVGSARFRLSEEEIEG